MGSLAVRFLVERIADPNAAPTQELFAPPISLRSSTGPASPR
jgi:DNA-binding LacI/PurR family transcriptional regulator